MKLEIIRNNEESANLLYDNKLGISSSVRGDLLQVVRCEEVSSEVSLRQETDGKCFFDLPIWYRSKPMFVSKSTKIIIGASSLVSCESESSVHHLDNGYVSQSPSIEVFTPKVKVLSAAHDYNVTLFAQKVTYQYGGLHGKVADSWAKAILTAIARKTGLRRAVNTVIASDFPEMPELSEEDNSWIPSLKDIHSFAKDVMAKVNFYGLVILYSILTSIVLLWVAAIIIKAAIHGIRSQETWETVLSLASAIFSFIRYFFILFRLVGPDYTYEPTAPKQDALDYYEDH